MNWFLFSCLHTEDRCSKEQERILSSVALLFIVLVSNSLPIHCQYISAKYSNLDFTTDMTM